MAEQRTRSDGFRVLATLALASALVACGGDESPPFERSCRGERYLDCDPFEYSVVASVSLEPAGLIPLDGMTRAHFRVEAQTCDMAPSSLSVQVQARVRGPRDDAGVPTARIIDLVTLRDDGLLGDPVADDGIIDVTIENPLIASVPSGTDIVLRFVPIVSGCDGAAAELEYRTGTRPPK